MAGGEDSSPHITLAQMLRASTATENIANTCADEACLMTHAAVLELAVIGVADAVGLVKPKAYVVCKAGQTATMDELKAHV